MTLHVCPLPAIEATLVQSGARHLLSVMGPRDMIAPMPGFAPDRHGQVTVNDIVVAGDGLVLAEAAHVRQILEFGKSWANTAPTRNPLVIHCWAGISRSTAAAVMILCDLNPRTPETEVAAALRDAAPFAKPNLRLIDLADGVLGRNGRLVAAIEALPEAQLQPIGTPFSLPAVMEAE